MVYSLKIIQMKLTPNLILLICIFLVQASIAQTYTISGYVEDGETGEKLLGATIYDSKSGKGTTANSYGFYSITLAQDTVSLRISFVGFVSDKQTFYLDKNTTVNSSLNSSLNLREVEVLASESERVEERSEMSTINLSLDKVKSLPVLLGEQDIMKTIQLLPGVQSGSEGSSGLYVRGGGPDQNLILLDGVPVYNASHLFGFFSVFNADAINSVKLIKGGFPAHYGGRLSSVIDIRMKEGNMKEVHGEGSIGLISSKLMIEGPIKKDKTSFIISGRRTYIDILSRPFIKQQTENGSYGGYFFYDFNAKINHKFSDKSRLYLSAYNGKDRFYAVDKYSYSNDGTTYDSESESGINWGNTIAAIRWNYLISPKLFSNTTITYSKYQFEVGFAETEVETDNTGTYTGGYSFEYLSGIQDFSGKVDFDYTPHPDHYVKFGMGYTNHLFTPGVNQITQDEGAISIIDTTFGSDRITAGEFWGYAEDDIKIGNRIKINPGIHFSGFNVNGKTYTSIQPGFSGRYMINEKLSAKASYSHMAQYLHLLTNAGIGLPTDLWVPPTDNIKPQFSNQVALGIAHTHGKLFEISVEGYYKTMSNLIEYKDGASFFGTGTDWESKIEVGNGLSYGAELLLEKKHGKTTGWVGYTLSWTNRQFENLNFGEVYPYRYDRRHDIGIAVTHEINDHVDIGVVWVYGTGNAVTLGTEQYQSYDAVFNGLNGYSYLPNIESIESRNNYRMPSYHRLDMVVNFHKKKKWGERTWSFGIYNMYNRQNPFYLFFSNDNQGNTRLTQISLFPIIPSFSYSFKF